MAQSDYNIGANPSGLAMRTEINTIFDSILSHNSGSTAPTVTVAFMMWVDASNATYYYLKMRNHDNTAWVTLGIYTVATKVYTSYTEDTVKLTGSQTKAGVLTFSSSPVAPTPTAQSNNTNVATTAYVDGKFIRGTAVASTSGTSIDFTSIPSWVKRITVMFNGVSTSGTSLVQIQLGSGSIQTTGYLGSTSLIFGSNLTLITSSTNGIPIHSNSPSDVRAGILNIDNISSNTWVASGVFGSGAQTVQSAGSVSLSGVLDRIRITTVNGTDTFDAGSINIMYEG